MTSRLRVSGRAPVYILMKVMLEERKQERDFFPPSSAPHDSGCTWLIKRCPLSLSLALASSPPPPLHLSSSSTVSVADFHGAETRLAASQGTPRPGDSLRPLPHLSALLKKHGSGRFIIFSSASWRTIHVVKNIVQRNMQ